MNMKEKNILSYELNLLKETLYKEYGLPKEVSFDKLICWEPAMESLQAQKISSVQTALTIFANEDFYKIIP